MMYMYYSAKRYTENLLKNTDQFFYSDIKLEYQLIIMI